MFSKTPLFLKYFLVLLLAGATNYALASVHRSLHTFLKTPGSPTSEASGGAGGKNPFTGTLTIGFPASLSEKKTGDASVPISDSTVSLTSANNTGKARIYEYGISSDQVDNPAWHHTNAALSQAMNLGVDMVYIHLSPFADFNVATTDIRNKLSEFNKPITVFLDKGNNTNGAIISLQPDSVRPIHPQNQVKTAVYKLNSNQFQEKYQRYVHDIMNQAANSKVSRSEIASSENVPASLPSLQGTNLEKTGTHVSSVSGNLLIYNYKPSLFERILDFLLQPLVSFFLIFTLLLGLLLELRKPGSGFPLFASTGAAILLFTPLHFDGLATYGEMILAGSGLLFLLTGLIWFKQIRLLVPLGILLSAVGMILSLTPQLSSVHSPSDLSAHLLKPVLIVSAGFITVFLLVKLFPSLSPFYAAPPPFSTRKVLRSVS